MKKQTNKNLEKHDKQNKERTYTLEERQRLAEQLMRVLREEVFPVERFMEELKDEGTAIPTHVFGHVSVN